MHAGDQEPYGCAAAINMRVHVVYISKRLILVRAFYWHHNNRMIQISILLLAAARVCSYWPCRVIQLLAKRQTRGLS